ncbi:MAG TPA: metal ABC transporter permease [Clostridia bacterium]|nr:metal ABC transporter permease [Clostridia bacterium]
MFRYAFMQNALAVSLLISILCPCIGVFLVLRRYSMIGDTLSHASLAGIAIGLLSGHSPIVGAFVFTSVCGALIELLRESFKKYTDLILTVVLSLSVGTAITLMSSGKLHANINSFMFGSILTVSRADLYTVFVLSIVSVLTVIFLYNQLVFITFDEEAAKIAGVRVRLINYVFSILVAAAIAVSIRIVGVLVLSSMIALPVATALQLQKGFKVTLLASIAFSVVDIMLGLLLSYEAGCAPGGLTALISVFLLLIVIVIQKARGILRLKSSGQASRRA